MGCLTGKLDQSYLTVKSHRQVREVGWTTQGGGDREWPKCRLLIELRMTFARKSMTELMVLALYCHPSPN